MFCRRREFVSCGGGWGTASPLSKQPLHTQSDSRERKKVVIAIRRRTESLDMISLTPSDGESDWTARVTRLVTWWDASATPPPPPPSLGVLTRTTSKRHHFFFFPPCANNRSSDGSSGGAGCHVEDCPPCESGQKTSGRGKVTCFTSNTRVRAQLRKQARAQIKWREGKKNSHRNL